MLLLRLILLNIHDFLNKRAFIIISGIFILYFLSSVYFYGGNFRLEGFETVILFFNGPRSINYELLRWSLHQVPILILAGLFVNKQFRDRSINVLIRVGSFKAWLNSMLISIVIFVSAYYILGYGINLMLLKLINNPGSILNADDKVGLLKAYSSSSLILHQLLLLIASTFVAILMNLFFTIITKNSKLSFTIIMIGIFVSIGIEEVNLQLNKWLPFNQGILSKHDTIDFTFSWSYAYIIISIWVLVVLLHYFGKTHLESLLTEESL